MNILRSIDWEKGDGLVPAVIQHALTGRVLMLGYMNEAALSQTQSTERVTFYSRSRQCLWVKGETSGNALQLRDIEVDCDADTLLIMAVPVGPTCHRMTNSCFDRDQETNGFGFFGRLETIIDERTNNRPDDSYTSHLLASGMQEIAKKVGEEGVEVALAAVSGNIQEIVNETADLMYHLMVMLRQHGLRLSDIAQLLDLRHRQTAAQRD